MIPTRSRLSVLFAVSTLIFPIPSIAFDSPLSNTGVREAYFLGQRRDGSLAELLDKYVLYLQPPETGPYVQSVSFLTPYVLTALNSSQQVGIYSAQQAQLDHQKNPEVVRITVQILLTDSYGPYIFVRQVRFPLNKGFCHSLLHFWREFRLRVFQKDQMQSPLTQTANPLFVVMIMAAF